VTAPLALAAENAAVGWTIAALGAAGTLCLLVAGLALPGLVAPGAVLVGLGYGILLTVDGGRLDRDAALVAAALLLACELSLWAHELRTTSPDEPGGRMRRLSWLVVLVLLALGLCACFLALVDLARVEGIAVETLGVAAAAAAFVLLWRVARDAGRRSGPSP
jgi:hypothetical protein